MVIDLTEPTEVKLQHEAIEDDPFARKVIKKGMLYFECKVVTIDQTGERITYVVKIDKSKSLHFEFEGKEAHILYKSFPQFDTPRRGSPVVHFLYKDPRLLRYPQSNR